MKEGNTTAMLEQLRLREVALNSIFAKTGQKIRVKAVKVHKNNNERVGLEVRDKELPIVLTYYPTADDMMQPDVRLIERIVDVLREERDEVGLIVHEPDMYIVSNRLRTNGAPLMFSKKIQGELLEMFGKRSVAVLPSSIDEFIAISADHMPIEELKDMVAEINRTQVAPEARLTDEVYVITGTPEKPILGMHTSLGLPGQTFLVARY